MSFVTSDIREPPGKHPCKMVSENLAMQNETKKPFLLNFLTLLIDHCPLLILQGSL
jgi:hypothetical protein